MISKNYSTRVCKKIFLTKEKKIFYTGCPKSAVRGGKTKFLKFDPFEKTRSGLKDYIN